MVVVSGTTTTALSPVGVDTNYPTRFDYKEDNILLTNVNETFLAGIDIAPIKAWLEVGVGAPMERIALDIMGPLNETE